MTRRTIKDAFPNFESDGGIFAKLATLGVPWAEVTEAYDLNQVFVMMYGKRLQSPMLSEYYDKDKTGVSSADMSKLANHIYAVYKQPWEHLWESYISEYNPIHNYDRTETHTGTITDTETPDGWTETDVRTPQNRQEMETENPLNWKTTTSGSASGNKTIEDDDHYGFNSQTESPVNKKTTSTDTNISVEQTGTMTRTKTESGTITNTHTEDGSRETVRDHDLTVRAFGNIGVTTTAQMIQGEMDLWANWSFFDTVFHDILKMLALPIY